MPDVHRPLTPGDWFLPTPDAEAHHVTRVTDGGAVTGCGREWPATLTHPGRVVDVGVEYYDVACCRGCVDETWAARGRGREGKTK
jgi:hypothetical protein